jgi:mRNA-degrading endonuclease toxin of MazEF toxin-antitoxin module
MLDFTPGRGSEQSGQRPALILQSDFGNQNPRYPNTVVLAMSTKGKPVPFHVEIKPTRRNGLKDVSYVKCEQILTVSKGRLKGRKALGRITPDQLKQVETAVKLSLGLR